MITFWGKPCYLQVIWNIWKHTPYVLLHLLTLVWIFLWYLSSRFTWNKFKSRRTSKTSSRWSSTGNVKIEMFCFMWSVFHYSNHLYVTEKKIVFQIPCFNVPEYLNLELSNFLKFLFLLMKEKSFSLSGSGAQSPPSPALLLVVDHQKNT